MTLEEITTVFATAATKFQPISGQPSDDDLTPLRDVLYPLLLDILYNQDGLHNLIGLIKPTTLYTATWGAPFPPLPRLPAYPIIDNAATAVVRVPREAEHAILVRDFASYEAAEGATVKFILGAIDKIWYRDLRHDRSFYTHVAAKQLLSHLDNNCGGLHPSELVNLPTNMLGFYATVDGIPEYINMLKAMQRKLARANLPTSDDQILAIASPAVLASNHFPRPTDDWEAKLCANKTWTAWKTHYRAAHIARKHQLLASGTAMPPSTANALLADDDIHLTEGTFAQLDGYLGNLAFSATTERTTLQFLTEANAALVANVTAFTRSVASLTAAYTTLAAIQHASAPPGTATQQLRSMRANAQPSTTLPTTPSGYCWPH
eukprot:CCRYP_013958-RA/>CCRYP_013958-RA protein AED:0.44 eAED:0.44 QI:0/-1/0/1/-1/1/1/0/376